MRGAFVEDWPGTIEGCNCLYVTYCSRRNVRRGQLGSSSCSYNETRCGCADVSSTPARSLSIQSGSEFDQIVDQTGSFALLYDKIVNDNSCPPGHTLCQRLSAKEFSYCVPGSQCPLTNLKITQSASNPDPQVFGNSDYVKSKADTYLWFSRAGLGGPITDLKISQQFPCLNSKFISWNLGRPDFPLNHDNVRKCDQDKRYTDLNDQISEKLLFSLNQALHQTIDLIDNSNPQWSKYYRPLFPIKNTCQA